MEEVFIVQKRPANGVSNGFYYRIVDVRTGEAVNQNFLQAVQAENHCRQLNEVASSRTAADLLGSA
ncbi:MAG: hypothetical protein ACRES5_10575 [Pseudomonas sp.]